MEGECRHILLVDDEAILLRLGSTFLSRLGVEVHTASSGNTAIQALTSGLQPDLVLTDLNMRDGTGIDLLRFVRGSQQLAGVPVVVLSATHDQAEIDTVHQLGCTAFFAKPVDYSVLLDRIARLLGMQVREARRYRVEIPGLLHTGTKPVAVLIRDMSTGGIFFETDLRLEVGSEQTIELQAPQAPGLRLRFAVIRSRAPEDDAARYGYGARLLDAEHHRQQLEELLSLLGK